MIDHFRMLARYNRIANERIYEKCAQLDAAECRRKRQGSFGSIHGLLNHILLGDRIWMSRFRGGGEKTPPLDSILFESFPGLRSARAEEDAGIEEFFAKLDDEFLRKSFPYTNNQCREYLETAPVAVLHVSTTKRIIGAKSM